MYRQNAAVDRSLLILAFGGHVFGVRRGNGQLGWEVRVGDSGADIEIAIIDGVVIAATPSGLWFLEYLSGAVLKQAATDLRSLGGRPTMLVDDGHVYVARSGAVTCYTTRGDAVWFQPFTGKGHASVALGLPDNIRQADISG